MSKTYRTKFEVRGDSTHGVQSIKQVDQALAALDATGARAGRSIKSVSDQSAVADLKMESYARRAVGWAAAIAGIGATLGGFSDQLDHIDKIHKLNLRIDAGTEALSRYDYVAELSGTTLKQLSMSWQRQTRRVSEAAIGYGAARDALSELNLDAKALNKLKPEQQFYAIAQALSEVEGKGDRLRLANKIFDSEGAAAALQIINQGVTALDQMLAKADQLNLVVSQADADAVAGYNDAISNLDRSWQGLNKTVAVFVAESGTDTINGLADGIASTVGLVQYLDDALVVGAGVITARYVPALLAKIQAASLSVAANKAHLASELQLVRQLNHRAVQDQAAAQRSLKVASTAQLRSAAMARLAAANQTVIATETALTAATTRYAASATVAGRASSGLIATMGLLGGPVGVAILAATGLVAYAASVDEAKLRSQNAVGPIDQLALSLRELYRAASGGKEAHLKGQLVTGFLKNDLESLEQMIAQTAHKINELGQVKDDGFFGGKFEAAQRDLKDQKLRLDALSTAYEKLSIQQNKNTGSTGENGDGVKELTAAEKALMAQWQPKLTRLQELGQAERDLQAVLKLHPDAAEEVAAAMKNIAALRQGEIQKLDRQAEKNKQLIDSLGDELSLIKLGDRERAIQTQLRKLDASATDAQREAVRKLSGQLYDQHQALNKVKEAAKEAAKEADPYADAWDESTKRIDSAFADAWNGSYDSFEDFTDRLLDGFKQLLAEMAHLAITKPIALKMSATIGDSLGVPGVPGSSGGGTNVVDLASSVNSAYDFVSSGAADLFNFGAVGSSATGSLSAGAGGSYAADLVGMEAAGGTAGGSLWTSAPTDLASGLVTAGAGYLGAELGSAFGFEGGYSSELSSIYAAVGSVFGPLGAAAGGFLGSAWGSMIGPDPSDKTQWSGFTGADNAGFSGGFDGDKFSQENSDAATAVSAVLNRFNIALDAYSGSAFDSSMQVQVGNRDGIFVRSSATGTAGQLDHTPNGSATLAGTETLYSGRDLNAALDAAIEHMAAQQGVLLDVYREQTREGELLSDAYMRLHLQQDIVRQSLEGLGIPFNAVGDDALRLADELVAAVGGIDALVASSEFYYANFYSEQERAQKLVDQYTAVLDDFNQQFDVAIDSRDALRAYVDALDLSTEAGQAAYAAALQLAPSLIGLEQALSAVAPAATQAGGAVVSVLAGWSGEQQGALQQRAQLIYDSYQAELKIEQSLHDQKLALLNEQYQAGVTLLNQVRALALSDLSPLTPLQKQQEAKQQWNELLAQAQTGDVDSLNRLDAAGRAYIEHTQSMYGSGAQSVAAYAEVAGSLEALGVRFGDQAAHDQRVSSLNQQQLSIQQQLLRASNQQLSQLAMEYAELADIEFNTDAIARLLELLPDNLAAAISGMIGSASASAAGSVSGGVEDSAVRAHVAALAGSGWSGQALEERIYHDAVANGVTAAQLERSMGWASGTVDTWAGNNPDAVQALGDLPQFAKGGYHQGGYAIVGEEGPELAYFGASAQIYPANQTRQMLDSSGMEREIVQLRQEVQRLTRVVAVVGGEQVDATYDQTDQLSRSLNRQHHKPVAVTV